MDSPVKRTEETRPLTGIGRCSRVRGEPAAASGAVGIEHDHSLLSLRRISSLNYQESVRRLFFFHHTQGGVAMAKTTRDEPPELAVIDHEVTPEEEATLPKLIREMDWILTAVRTRCNARLDGLAYDVECDLSHMIDEFNLDRSTVRFATDYIIEQELLERGRVLSHKPTVPGEDRRIGKYRRPEPA